MTKETIMYEIIKKESIVKVGTSRKKKFNLMIEYKHKDNTSIVVRVGTNKETKEDFGNALDRGYNMILNAILIIYG